MYTSDFHRYSMLGSVNRAHGIVLRCPFVSENERSSPTLEAWHLPTSQCVPMEPWKRFITMMHSRVLVSLYAARHVKSLAPRA
jgi:hypothetical protein